MGSALACEQVEYPEHGRRRPATKSCVASEDDTDAEEDEETAEEEDTEEDEPVQNVKGYRVVTRGLIKTPALKSRALIPEPQLGEEEDILLTGAGAAGKGKGSKRKLQAGDAKANNIVRCEDGHAMNAKVAREVLETFRCTRSWPACQACEAQMEREDAYYRCRDCDYNLCMWCAREQLNLPGAERYHGQPPLQVGPGDILLVGGNDWDILHVILVTGNLQQTHDLADVEGLELGMVPGQEVWKCTTIESTQGARGTLEATDGLYDVEWYPSTTYLLRDPFHAESWFIAQGEYDHSTGREPEWKVEAGDKQPVKVLHHPLRAEYGNPVVDKAAFRLALEACAEGSQTYGYRTLVQAAWAYQHKLNIDDYQDQESLEDLVDKIEASWAAKPICAAVPVKVWQRYFVSVHGERRDEAAKAILQFMPVLCNQVTPSALVKSLTSQGWVLSGSLEA